MNDVLAPTHSEVQLGDAARAILEARAEPRVGVDFPVQVFSGDFSDVAGGGPRPYDIDDATGPLSVYGRTKLRGELAVLAAMPDAGIVRTSWVYEGADGSDFVAAMRRRAAGDGDVEVVADLCTAILQIADSAIREPVLHAANAGAVSRFEQAQAVFDELGADPSRVKPVTGDRQPRPASRPPYSVLSAAKSEEAGLTPLRDWRAALAAAIGASR